LQDAKQGDEIVLELFDDVSLRARVTGRWEEAEAFRLAAILAFGAPMAALGASSLFSDIRGLIRR
jgi:hypothetical protein